MPNLPFIIVKPREEPGRRAYIPAWLTDPDIAAPCHCGDPLLSDQPYVMGETEEGMRRWFHVDCWQDMGFGEEWE